MIFRARPKRRPKTRWTGGNSVQVIFKGPGHRLAARTDECARDADPGGFQHQQQQHLERIADVQRFVRGWRGRRELQFNSVGTLIGWALGGTGGLCAALNRVSSGGADDFYVTGGSPYNGTSAEHDADSPGWMIGGVRSWTATKVPEPATLVLLGLGLLGVAAARRKHAL